MNSMEDLFVGLLQDVYFAERQIRKSPEPSDELGLTKSVHPAFGARRSNTREQIVRLEKVFEIVGRRARMRHSDSTAGLLADAEALIQGSASNGVRDAGILATVHALNHSQIARYEILIAMAQRLNEPAVVRLLRKSLAERMGVARLDRGAGLRAMQAA